MTLSNTKLKNRTNRPSRFFPEIRKSDCSLPIQRNHTATPACQTVVHHFHGQVTLNYVAGVTRRCLLREQQLKSLLVANRICGFASPLQLLQEP